MKLKQTRNTPYQAATPCQNCIDRSLGCHGNCSDYQDYKYKRLQAYYVTKHKPLSQDLLIV